MGVTRFPYGIEIGDGTTAGDFTIGGTAVTATASQLNESVDHALAHGTTDGKKVVWNGGTVITGAGTVAATGLTTIAAVTGSLSGTVALAGTAAGYPHTVQVGHNGGGSVIIQVFDALGSVATGSGTVSFIAAGV